jgi:aryl-alcohol dehydrogenase-like predicted oxidoreductase
MMMETRRLGAAPFEVSALALGCFSMTPIYGTPDPKEGIATIHRALELGINHFDTADVYADGANEELVGLALRSRRDKAIIATKFGQVKNADGTRRIDGSPEYVQAACEASLKRLGTDYIDLFYQHRVDPGVPADETAGAIKRLIEDGKIRAYGISEARASTVRAAHAIQPLAAVQLEYSLWTRFVEDQHLPQCRELGIGLVAYAPLGRGFLSGAVTNAETLKDPGDTRSRHPRFSPENIEHNLRVIQPLADMARHKGCTMAQLALAWVAGEEGIFPLTGAGRRTHLEENAAALEIDLTPEERRTLSDRINPEAIKGERYPPEMMGALNV